MFAALCSQAPMIIKTEKHPHYTLLGVTGEIDLYNTGDLKTALEIAAAQSRGRIIINLGQAGYIDSTGIGALLRALGECKKQRGNLVISSPAPSILKVFELTRLTNFFLVCPNDKTAAEHFLSEP